MTKAFRFIPALGAVLFALVGLSACGGIPGDAVVQVNGKPITKTTFDHWLGIAAASTAGATGTKPVLPEPPNYTACIAHLAATAPKPAKGQSAPTTAQLKTQCEQQYKALQQEVLGFLISSEWVLGEAESLGVKVSDGEVKKQFAKIKATEFPKAAEFERFLASSGESVSDLLLRVKLNMVSQKIQQKIVKEKGTPTHAEIEKYYNENKSRFGVPEKRNVLIILTKTEAQANAAKKAIESGTSFESEAKSVSIDPTSKAKGGQLNEVVKGEEETQLDEAIFTAKTNVLVGPVKTSFGYYILKVTSIKAGSQSSLKQVEATIKQQLAVSGNQKALATFVKEFKKKWTSKTECRAEYTVSDCSSYKAPKTSTSTSAVP